MACFAPSRKYTLFAASATRTISIGCLSQYFWATVTSNGSPYVTGPLSCLSVTLVCGQTVGWIKVPLGTEVGLGLGDTVLDGNPIATPKRGTAPNFRPMSIVAKRHVCIRIPHGTEVGVSLGDIVLDGDPSPPPLKGTNPNFRPISVVAKRLDGLRCHLVWR